jgi:hypothetical protein
LYVVGVVLITASLLTYEAHLLLVAYLPVLAVLAAHPQKPSARFPACMQVAGLAAPIVVFAIANVVGVLLTPRATYQMSVAIDLSASYLSQQFSNGLRVLFVDAWRTPAELLAANAVPRVDFAVVGAIVFVVWCSVLVWLAPSRAAVLPRPTAALAVGMGLISTLLCIAIFAPLGFSLAQPDRMQTFTLTGAALVAGTGLFWMAQSTGALLRVGARYWTRLFAVACGVLVVLFLAMASVYQRNARDTWREQRQVLASIIAQAPRIETGTLLVITNLPDTRIVIPAGYDCEFALTYLLGLTLPPPAIVRRTAEERVGLRVNCALMYQRGRALDPSTRVEFRADGANWTFQHYTYLFPYNRLLVFEFDETTSTARLLSDLPDDLARSVAAADYRPHNLFKLEPPRPQAQRVLR